MTRRATVRTEHAAATTVAAAVEPDNTDEMETTVEAAHADSRPADGAVVTRIERETTGGLHSTVDDYVVNLDVATTVVQRANQPTNADDDVRHEDTRQ